MTQKGFTLVEVLVALTLLSVGLVPAFIQASNALTLSTTIRNALIAANVAQEGIEVVRSMRDDNWFAGRAFNAGLDACTGGCRVEWSSDVPQDIGKNIPLKFDAATGMYQYGSGVDSPFQRKITITQVSPVELSVLSEVTWRERKTDKRFVVESHLFNWLP